MAAISFYDIDQIINNSVFKPHDNIQIPKSDIGINQQNFKSMSGKGVSYICGCRSLSDTAFSLCNNDHFTHDKSSSLFQAIYERIRFPFAPGGCSTVECSDDNDIALGFNAGT